MSSLLRNRKAPVWHQHPAGFSGWGGGGRRGFFLPPDTWSIPGGGCAARWEMAAQPASIAAGLRGLPRDYLGFKERSESH